jgi:predicted RNase H-like HicB family nuclease
MKKLSLTALIEKEGDGFVSLCPEFDIASQGETIEEATSNLKEAVELFLETAPREEVNERYDPQVIISRFEATYA